MKIRLAPYSLMHGGMWLPVLWQVTDWEIDDLDEKPSSHTDLVWPRMGVHGVLLNEGDFGQNLSVATGKIDGRNPPCGMIRVETPKMIEVPIISFTALVRCEETNLEGPRAIYICDKLTFIEKVEA